MWIYTRVGIVCIALVLLSYCFDSKYKDYFFAAIFILMAAPVLGFLWIGFIRLIKGK